jgi:hypothetical protein
MSISALEALRAIDLLDKHDRSVDLSSLDSVTLQKKINYYRDTRLRSIGPEVRGSASSDADVSAVVSSRSARHDVESLVPSCLLYNKLYVNDPLVLLAEPLERELVSSKAFGMSSSGSLSIDSAKKAIDFFRRLAPLIRLGVLVVLPIREATEPVVSPNKGIPLLYSEDWFRSEVPSHIHDFVHHNAITSEVAPINGGGFAIYEHAPTAPTRGISISFKDDAPNQSSSFYLLAEMRATGKIGDAAYRVQQSVDWDKKPSQSSYDAWHYQSVNRTILNRLGHISREVQLASQLQATYLTESKFESDLCGMAFGPLASPSHRHSAVNFLNANEKFLSISDPSLMVKLRVDHPRLFEQWQASLLAGVRELSGCDGDFDSVAREFFATEIQPQIDNINKAAAKVGGELLGAATVATGGILLALHSSPLLPFTTVLELGALAFAGKVIPGVTEYLSSRKGPAFVWSKMAKK